MEIRRKEGESPTSLMYRFSKRVKQSGILREARKRRFRARPVNRRRRRLSALHREAKKKEVQRLKKLGLL
ncbi:MAG: 30S ribosomal protein S21 [Candidatus Liptonbacteria bacterium]|nr:30S ribosomal protein S21 [Candidatus Liptonbacteria bacterium]